jgi:small-conductance mechanosensitive channel
MDRAPGFSGPLELPQILVALALLVAGPIVGWLLQRTVVVRLQRRATRTSWEADDIVIDAIHNVLIVWLTVGGIFGAASVLSLSTRLQVGLQRLLVAVLILSVTVMLARMAGAAIRRYSQRAAGVMRSTSIFVNIARFLILVIGILVLLQTYGISIAPILTALGVGGLAVALALQDTLSNLFAGLQIIGTRKVKPGDFVQLETGQEGYVTDVDWRHTSIRMLPNNLVLVPNSKLVNSVVVNCHYPSEEMSVLVQVGVAYDSDLRHVERVTAEVATEVLHNVEGGARDFEPLIRFHTFNESSIDFTVVLRAREFADQYLLKHEFVKRLHRRYKAEGIVIPFPIRTLDLQPADVWTAAPTS